MIDDEGDDDDDDHDAIDGDLGYDDDPAAAAAP